MNANDLGWFIFGFLTCLAVFNIDYSLLPRRKRSKEVSDDES